MRPLLFATCTLAALSACNQASFAGGSPQRAGNGQATSPAPGDPAPPGQPSPGQPPPGRPDSPQCHDQTHSIGVQVAFLIDNSSSNESSDCPDPVASDRRKPNGTPTYVCRKQTHREQAVLSAYDLLASVAAADKDNAPALSSLSVLSFPTTENAGFTAQQGWTAASGDDGNRDELSQGLRFARAPYGQTPYGEAIRGARELFSNAASDERAKVAILVTDGEPTDADPGAVAADAAELKKDGVKIITIYVTGAKERSERQAAHRRMMQTYGRSWYASHYGGFDEYFAALAGLGEELSNGSVVEIDDASGLEKAVRGVLGQAVRCE